jgi:predicted dehydrogenase/nucleoside-diphosphate-sugar epimerase
VSRNSLGQLTRLDRSVIQPHLDKKVAPVRVAVVGCGAITRRFHLPVLAGYEGARVTALVDRDVTRAQKLARAYGVETVLADAGRLHTDLADAVVVATPPFHHAPCCIDLAGRGFHLLVEKPMAVTAADARAMADAAERAGVVLTVGHFRRLFPAVRLLRAALDGGALGRPIGFNAEEGDTYGWDLETLSNLRKDQGGGGVLIDIGSHVLDLLLYFFPGPFQLVDYEDNALGGVETDCRLRLQLAHAGSAVEGCVELSRTRRLRSTIRVHCERGTLELRTGERHRLALLPPVAELQDPAGGKSRPVRLEAAWADEPEQVGYEGYRAEIDDWLAAIRSGQPPLLSAASTLRTVELIETCYRRSRRIDEPWVWETLPALDRAPSKPEVSETPAVAASPQRVLVTGATGFIGCRVAEALHLGRGWQVRALVHKPSSAARLARLPVEMVHGDLKSRRDMEQAVAGCDAVVHCAVGTAYGDRREVFDVTVEGTRTLVEAARAAGVRRFVHLSTIAIFGVGARAVIDDSTLPVPLPGDEYGESKAGAERVVRDAARAGLPAIMLRPGCVYGPYSNTFIVRPLRCLAKDGLVLAGCAGMPSNTVYVDNLVHAIFRSLDAPRELADGRAFFVTDGDDWTWGEFYGFFAAALGHDLHTRPEAGAPPARQRWKPFGWLGALAGGTGDLLTSPQCRALGRLFLERHPLGRLPRHLLQRYPWFDQGVRKLLRTDAVDVYRRPAAPAADELKMHSRFGPVLIDGTRKHLGYEPPVSRERAMALTLEWVREARLA